MADDNGTRTHYVVLEYHADRDTDEGAWRKLGETTANGADQARRLVAQQQLDLAVLKNGVDLVAITKRAWDAGQGTVVAKTETRVVSS